MSRMATLEHRQIHTHLLSTLHILGIKDRAEKNSEKDIKRHMLLSRPLPPKSRHSLQKNTGLLHLSSWLNHMDLLSDALGKIYDWENWASAWELMIKVKAQRMMREYPMATEPQPRSSWLLCDMLWASSAQMLWQHYSRCDYFVLFKEDCLRNKKGEK